ncbi:unannotated protein [freshwater metagenome]|uniref:Unannotated protein n=1 Tax=freshwater metagenome TaxID=449393 RepID=A0A6J6VNC2_9ZZZZ
MRRSPWRSSLAPCAAITPSRINAITAACTSLLRSASGLRTTQSSPVATASASIGLRPRAPAHTGSSANVDATMELNFTPADFEPSTSTSTSNASSGLGAISTVLSALSILGKRVRNSSWLKRDLASSISKGLETRSSIVIESSTSRRSTDMSWLCLTCSSHSPRFVRCFGGSSCTLAKIPSRSP